MRISAVAAFAVLFSLVLVSAASAQTLSCDKPIGAAETEICSDQSLISLEGERAALAGDANDGAWIEQRDACGGNTECLTTAYLNQVQLLRLGAPANESPYKDEVEEAPLEVPSVGQSEEPLPPLTSGLATDQPTGSSSDGAVIGFIAALFGVVFVVVGGAATIANYSWNKFQYRVFLNPINLFNGAAFFLVVVAITLHENISLAITALLVALGIWLIVLVQNARRTNIVMGPVITLTQNLAFLMLFFVWLSRQRSPR